MAFKPKAAATDEIPARGRAALAEMLRRLGNKVRGVNTRFGRNPEKVMADNDEVAAELDKLAAMLDGGAR